MRQGKKHSKPTYRGIPVFSVLIALEDDGQFLYNPQSFKDDQINGKKGVNREYRLIVKKGTIIVFHPMLLHAGGGYGIVQHTRLHFYILPNGCKLAKSKAVDGNSYVSTHFAPETKEIPSVREGQFTRRKPVSSGLTPALLKYHSKGL